MTSVELTGGRPLRGRIRVPGDKSISHRALILAARASGTSRLRSLSNGDDVRRTTAAVRSLGAAVEDGATDGAGTDGIRVTGGVGRLHPSETPIDVGNSGTTIRLLSGFCAAFPWLTVLTGDESVSRRPMDRVVAPLRHMGASVECRQPGCLAPLTILGGSLRGIDYFPPVASAQLKGAVLLAGLGAEGQTVVHERAHTRVHTEELLAACGADVEVSADGLVTCLRPSELQPFELDVPGDPSQAAFWLVAACITPGSEVVVERVYVGPGRDGFMDVLGRMGADLDVEPLDDTTANLHARFGPLRATEVGVLEIPGVIDEIPALAVAAAVAEGVTSFQGAGELRVKETDRIATLASELAAVGGRIEALADGLVIRGVPQLSGGHVRSHGDHRVAMALAVAGLAGPESTRIEGWEAVATSYPDFAGDLQSLL
ncbi:MAG: 3-phosphoshikimate 1-carboxyvinyltransferase [Actinomycetota bacterium]|nr:3-phosphoshikimate 1-carboxyvinyltransferase [Actinomycetota bacterium]